MAMKNLYNRYTNYYKTIFVLFFIMTLGGMTGLAQAIVEPFTPRTSSSTPNRTIYSIKGDFTMIGNTNMSINPDPDASNDNNDNNGQTNPSYYVDVDSDPTTWNSSRAELVLYEDQDVDPACSEIVFAGLYWTGRAHNGGSSPIEFDVGGSTNNRTNGNTFNGYSLGITSQTYSGSPIPSVAVDGRLATYTFTPVGSGDPVVFRFYSWSTSSGGFFPTITWHGEVTVQIGAGSEVNVPGSLT